MIASWGQRFATAIRRPTVAYAAALAGVAAAAALRGAFGLAVDEPPTFSTFFPAILFATWVAGARGGLLAIAASVVVVSALWLPEGAEGLTGLALFLLTAGLTLAFAAAMRAALLRGVVAQDRFRIAQEAAVDGFFIFDPVREEDRVVDFAWAYANPAAERLTATQDNALIGRRALEVLPGAEGEELVERLRRTLETGGPDEVEVRRVIEGQERWLRSSAVRLRDGVAMTFRDVTEQRAAETSLRVGEARVRALVDTLPQLIWACRRDGRCDYVSPQWARFTGEPAERHLGSGWIDSVHPDDRYEVSRAWDEAVGGGAPADMEFRLRRSDGIWRWFAARPVPMLDEGGAARRWFIAATDITEIVEARRDLEERVAERTRELEASLEERARAQAALTQAQRLETVGRLTGGVAHDFNNLLTVVIGGLDMILRAPQNTARVTRLAEAALAAGRRGERLTRQLLAFSRRQELKFETVELDGLVEQVEPLLRRAAGEGVDLQVRSEPDLGAARLDAAQFEAALLNLVVNAADATDGGGGILIETARVTLAEGEVQDAAPGDYVRVRVTDTGAGMAPDVLQRVFEPFFTTKDVGKGTGLGLAQVYGFVSQCGGVVAIESTVGHGTSVSLYLPRAPAQGVLDLPQPPPPREDFAHGARVLLVEDDPSVRTVAESLLVELGCEVTAEPDGAAALGRLDTEQAFDLMISDIVMPGGMSGVDLARTVQSRRPGLPIVLATGYAGQRLEDSPDEIAWPILRKPFRAEQLQAVLRQALSRTLAAE